jgi:hypothetical protein
MKNLRKRTFRKKLKVYQEFEGIKQWVTIYIRLTEIDKKINDEKGIRLIEVIAGKCPDIALKLVQILLNLSDK